MKFSSSVWKRRSSNPHGNWLARYVFPELVCELQIEVDAVADMTVCKSRKWASHNNAGDQSPLAAPAQEKGSPAGVAGDERGACVAC